MDIPRDTLRVLKAKVREINRINYEIWRILTDAAEPRNKSQ